MFIRNIIPWPGIHIWIWQKHGTGQLCMGYFGEFKYIFIVLMLAEFAWSDL